MATHRFDLLSAALRVSPGTLVFEGGVEYGLAELKDGWRLAVLANNSTCGLIDFIGERSEFNGRLLLVCPLTAHNAAALRARLAWLQPRPLGLRTSAGMGDRLGLATPGHIRAVRLVDAGIAPVFAQQSIREMTRTGRTPQQVMGDATWGMFSQGWQDGAGADADHLKTFDDIDACLAAGFTLFTIDPGSYVDDRAERLSLGELRELAGKLPEENRPRLSGLQEARFDIEGLIVHFDEVTLLRAAVKYGMAVRHVAGMYRHLEDAAGGRPFELEVSVDETAGPTSHAEHIYIACELKRCGVRWISLAPRFVGRFEKGVDYIGDVKQFESDISGHAAIARQFGPYKLSLHSGSDKFSIYAAAASQAHGLVHLKTAGTSYLEALRTVSSLDVGFLREIYIFARGRYETDRVTYHVSAEVDCAPRPEAVTDWRSLLDQFDAREILHVTFGSVLTECNADGQPRFRDRLLALLRAHPELYAANLERHFVRHLQPFAQWSTA